MTYDSYVTSPSVLDWATGAKFLEAISTPGPVLTDEPIPLEGVRFDSGKDFLMALESLMSIPPIPRPLEDREKPR